MGVLQEMENECDCVEVIFQDYIQSRNTEEIFLFFEGKDDYKYYWCRLSPFIGRKSYKNYNCNGKERVVIIHDMIKNKTEKREGEKKLYFVDKDFDKENVLSDEIYVTPTYSIENLYVSDRAIKNMIIGEFGLSSERDSVDEKDLEVAVEYLKKKRDGIIDSMIYANAWYSLQYNKTKKKAPYPKLSAIKEYHVIKDVINKNVLQKLVPYAVDVTEEELEKEIKYLREKPSERLRGKYFEQTMPTYIMEVFNDSNKKDNRKIITKKRKVRINVGADNMISVLSNYADIPDDLIDYISERFKIN